MAILSPIPPLDKGVMIVVEEVHQDSTKNRILFIIENTDKPWKRKGQYSVPAGIIEANEGGTETVGRELEEEVGIVIQLSKINLLGNFRINITSNNTPKQISALADVYKVELTPEEVMGFQDDFRVPENEEISGIRWFTKYEIFNLTLNQLRPGNIEALNIAAGAQTTNTVWVHNGLPKI